MALEEEKLAAAVVGRLLSVQPAIITELVVPAPLAVTAAPDILQAYLEQVLFTVPVVVVVEAHKMVLMLGLMVVALVALVAELAEVVLMVIIAALMLVIQEPRIVAAAAAAAAPVMAQLVRAALEVREL